MPFNCGRQRGILPVTFSHLFGLGPLALLADLYRGSLDILLKVVIVRMGFTLTRPSPQHYSELRLVGRELHEGGEVFEVAVVVVV